MSTALEPPHVDHNTGATFAKELQKQTAAVRLTHAKFGVRKSLSKQQIQQAAASFHAEADQLNATKKLLDTRDEHYRAATQVISRARNYWRMITVPYPIPGIRLIRKDLIPEFDSALVGFRGELQDAAKQLEDKYAELRNEAQERLGELFDTNDYPSTLQDRFSLGWDYPSVDPPDYLRQLNPKLYEEQQQRVAERFEEAVRMAEDAFTSELQKLVSHLVDRLSGEEDGKPKVFRDSAISNLSEFIDRFRSMSIGSNEELSRLVDEAERIVGGVDAGDLRKDANLKKGIAAGMAKVAELLDGMVVNQPGRAINVDQLED